MNKLLLPVILFLFYNCASSYAGIATSNIPIVNKKYKVIAPVEKEQSWRGVDIGIIATEFDAPPIERMVSSSIQENNADALINIKYWQDKRIFFFLTFHRLHITAEAIKFENEEGNASKKIR